MSKGATESGLEPRQRASPTKAGLEPAGLREGQARKSERKEWVDVIGSRLIEMMKSELSGQQDLVLFRSFKTTILRFDCLQPKPFLEITLPHLNTDRSWM